MKVDMHVARYRESLEALELAVERGIGERQRTVGFHVSAAAVDLLSIYLFREKLISPGTQIQHSWFRSRGRIAEAIPFDFPNKVRILVLMEAIETSRDPLCYGRSRDVEEIRQVLERFQELRAIFRSMGVVPDEA